MMKLVVSACILLFFLAGCKKSENLNLDTNLTGCPEDTDCTHTYQDNTDFSTNYNLVNGNYRLFNSHFVQIHSCDNATDYFFKAPMGNGSFIITDAEIASGNAVYYSSFSICGLFLANVHPIGGEIKGTKIDANRWLLNSKIILGVSKNQPLYTVMLNQYYSKK
jgi:hypothetical protein